jgi:hypothetical protein
MVHEREPKFVLAQTLIRLGEIEKKRLKQSSPIGQMAVRQKNVADIRAEPFQESMAKKGFSGARLAGENGNSLKIEDRGLECGESAFVTGGRIIIIAIRSGSERPAF